MKVVFLHSLYYHKPLLQTPQAVIKYVYENQIDYLKPIDKQQNNGSHFQDNSQYSYQHAPRPFFHNRYDIHILSVAITGVKTRDIT